MTLMEGIFVETLRYAHDHIARYGCFPGGEQAPDEVAVANYALEKAEKINDAVADKINV